MDKKAMHKLSYGLYVVTTRNAEKANGCIVNTAIQAASTPNQICVCINKANYTHDMLLKTGVFNVSVLSRTAEFPLYERFGIITLTEEDKLAHNTAYKYAEKGVPYITEGTNAYIAVKVTQTVDLGSHTMFIGEVTEMEVLSEEPSANYEYYQENIKLKPVDTGKTVDGQTVWRCTICGYEYVGEELPKDFICPLCKHPASDFEKVIK